jgi:hypothetical protein
MSSRTVVYSAKQGSRTAGRVFAVGMERALEDTWVLALAKAPQKQGIISI